MIEARGQGHTLKCALSIDDSFGPNEQAAFKAQVSGMFRVMYQEWADKFAERIVVVTQF